MSDVSLKTHQYAIAALRERRSIVAGEAAQIECQLRIRQDALAHLDAVLRMLAPEADPAALPIRRARHKSEYPIPGLTRRVLAVLRRQGAPMATADVVEAIAGEMGFGPEGVRAIHGRVGFTLRNLYKDGARPVLKTGERAEAMWSLR